MPKTQIVIPTAQHEPTDIGERFVWAAVAVLLAMLLLCAFIVWWLYPQATLDRTLNLPLPIYPAPRLQPNPPEDMQQLRTAALQRLNSMGWDDTSQTVAHIPITQAMQMIAEQGIVDWPTASGKEAR